MSIRTRLMITTSAIVLVVVGVLSIGIYSTFSRQLVRQVDKSLDDRVVMIADSLRRESQRPNIGRQRNPLNEALLPTRFDTVTQVVDTTGTVVLALGEVELPVTDKTLQIANDPNGRIFRSTVTIDGDKYRMLTVPLTGGGALQLAKDINDLQRAQNAVRGWQFALGPIGIVFAGIAGWWVARRTARPIQQLADAAEEIARTQNLSTKLDIHGDHEIEQLASSFNTMLAALQYSSEQQKQLVQDASHELRTPLTSLRANAELLQRDSLDEATKQAVLRDIAARASRRTGRLVTVTSTNPASALVRPSQFDRAISNLVDNALKFCPTPDNVEINIIGPRVEVIDHGQGIADTDKPLVFDRFYRATATRALPGSGLGLAIVKQFADDHSAAVTISDTPGGGATVSLSFENRVK